MYSRYAVSPTGGVGRYGGHGVVHPEFAVESG